MLFRKIRFLRRLFKRERGAYYTSLFALMPFVRVHWPYLLGGVLFIIATGLSVLWLGYGLRQLIDNGFRSITDLTHSILLLSFFVVLLACASYGRLFFISQLGERVAVDLRRSLFKKLLYLDADFYERHMTGDLLARLVYDTAGVHSFLVNAFPLLLRNIVIALGGVGLLYYSNLKLALIVSFCFPLVVLPLFVFDQMVRLNRKKKQERLDTLSAHAEEVLSSIKTVQAFNQELSEAEHFNNELSKGLRDIRQSAKSKSFLAFSVIVVSFGTIGLIVWIGGMDVIAGHLTSGQLTLFCFYSLAIAGSLGAISEYWGDLQKMVRCMKRLTYLWDAKSMVPVIDLPKPFRKQAGKFHISFKNVTFAYPGRPHIYVLKNVSFDIPYGQTAAFVGSSGAGKTTLFELLMRFYDPQEGEIFLEGQDIRTIPLDHLRSQIGLVSQDCHVFSGTVYDNIAYGAKDASRTQVMEVVRMSGVHEFVKRLPQKIKSLIGQRGISLSGGQRQRIAIARTLLKNAPILLMDEATSSLDAQQEYYVHQAVERLLVHKTTLVVAHRLTTVQKAEVIFVLNQGRIVASGKHRELLRTSKIYKHLANLQFLDKDVEE